VKEQSHKDEMSKALRGDFERLRDRGVATTLAPPNEQQAQPTPDEPEPVEEPEPEPELIETIGELEPAPEPVTRPAAEEPVAEAEDPGPGWLGRLLGR
jgi:hypothetical protein